MPIAKSSKLRSLCVKNGFRVHFRTQLHTSACTAPLNIPYLILVLHSLLLLLDSICFAEATPGLIRKPLGYE